MKHDKQSSLTKGQQLAHPEWVGKMREVKQMLVDDFYEVECFV